MLRRETLLIVVVLLVGLLGAYLFWLAPRPLTCLAGPQVGDHCTVDPALTGGVLANGTVVDGVRVGEPFDCPVSVTDCKTRLRMATDAAIARHGLAPTAIGHVQFYLPYLQPGAAYGSGALAIVVFDLGGGSQAAVNTSCFDGCYVVDPQPIAP